jgi:hypothetical protein
MEIKKYTSLSLPFKVKDKFVKLNIDWNMKYPNQRKTKEEFMELILNAFVEWEKNK